MQHRIIKPKWNDEISKVRRWRENNCNFKLDALPLMDAWAASSIRLSSETCTGSHFHHYKYCAKPKSAGQLPWCDANICKMAAKRHESEPPRELTAGWFARLQLSHGGGIIYPPPLYWIPAVKCKLQPLRKRWRQRWRMAPEAAEQPMNLWLMSRLISRRATSALTINLHPHRPTTPPLPVDIWLTHRQTHPASEWKPAPAKQARLLQRQRCTLAEASRQDSWLAASCPLMYYSGTLRGILLE